jgi:NAD(P)-dependent dehydrogenase (short-subunit alcohol dehydrogenase family)
MQAEARRAGISEAEALSRALKRLPLGRLAEPEEIADIALFAASERGRFLTGANISADGVANPIVV